MQRILIAAEEPPFGRMFAEALECDGYPVTRVDKAGQAFVAARNRLQPLVVVVDYHMLQFQNFVALFTAHANEMPPLEWVVFGCKHEDLLTDEMNAFIAERTTKTYPWTFDFWEVLAAIERVAERLPGSGITGATRADPGGSSDDR
jgi:CheY-like chemotaxis protein